MFQYNFETVYNTIFDDGPIYQGQENGYKVNNDKTVKSYYIMARSGYTHKQENLWTCRQNPINQYMISKKVNVVKCKIHYTESRKKNKQYKSARFKWLKWSKLIINC